MLLGLLRSQHLCSQSALQGETWIKGTRSEANYLQMEPCECAVMGKASGLHFTLLSLPGFEILFSLPLSLPFSSPIVSRTFYLSVGEKWSLDQ